jgi:hypothetical protein
VSSLVIELLGDILVRVDELLQELGGDTMTFTHTPCESASEPVSTKTTARHPREVVTTGQSLDLTDVSERSTHDDGLVVVLLVVAGREERARVRSIASEHT